MTTWVSDALEGKSFGALAKLQLAVLLLVIPAASLLAFFYSSYTAVRVTPLFTLLVASGIWYFNRRRSKPQSVESVSPAKIALNFLYQSETAQANLAMSQQLLRQARTLDKKGRPGDALKLKAFELYQEAAILGNNEALNNYAIMLADGEIGEPNPSEAIEILERAARRGDILAMFNFAIMLKNGEGTYPRVDEAAYWLRKAADAGHSEAARLLSNLLQKQADSDAFHAAQRFEF